MNKPSTFYSTPPPTTQLSDVRIEEVVVSPTDYTPYPVELLHPNLARLAAIYDQIVEAHIRGRIDARVASAEIRKLQARDDQGVVWSIRDDGCWYRQTREGKLIPDTPPTTGIPAVSPFDVSPANYRSENPDYRLRNQGSVSRPQVPTYEPGTRVAHSDAPLRRFWNWKHKFVAISASALIVAATLTGIAVWSNAQSNDSAPSDIPVAQLIIEP